MRLLFTIITLLLSVVITPACSGQGADEDPWAAGSKDPNSPPRTRGFGETDFEGPEQPHQERSGPDTSGPEDCTDKVDNDANGKADCDDPFCATDPACMATGQEDCDNQKDEDGDEKVDCEDPDCAADPVCLGDPSQEHEQGFEDCDNKLDDDKDNKVDCEDPDCVEDLNCTDDPSRDESVALVDPAKLAEVAKLPEGSQVGMRAPDFHLPLIGRKGKQRLSELRGYTVLLNFWASWCAPCRKEVPALELTWQLYRDKHVVVIGISIDDNKSDAEDFLGTFPVSYPMLHDPEGKQAAQKWQVNSVPTLILIDSAGRIRKRHKGYTPKQLRKTVLTIDELLEK